METDNLKNELYGQESKTSYKWDKIKDYIKGCLDPENARLYGTFQERASLNVTQFPKIQGSLLIRMGLVYPIMSYLIEQVGIPKDYATEILGAQINYHTWLAGYLAYLTEIQLGLSKYPIEWATKTASKIKNNSAKRKNRDIPEN